LIMWSLPDWCEPYPDCAIGVGKKMNVSLETLRDDVPRPKWAHFGPRKNSDTAAMAQEILNSPEYKALEQNSEELPFAESAAEAVDSEPKPEQPATQATVDTSEMAVGLATEVNHSPVVSEQASKLAATGLTTESVLVEEVAATDATAGSISVPAEDVAVTAESIEEQTPESVTAEESPAMEEISSEEAVVSEKAEVVAAEGQAGAGAPEETKESAPKEEMVKSEESLPVEGWIKAAEGIEEFVTKEQTEDLKEPEKSGETTTTINSEVKTPEPEKK